MPDRLKNKVAVVTGSTSGIGEGIVRAFAAEGACVVVSGRRADRGEAVAASIRQAGGQGVFQQADLTVPEDCLRLIRRAAEAFGGLDVLVNNAGIFPRAKFEDTSVELWDAIFDTNIRGAFLCCQAAVPLMRQRGGGSIINIGSLHPFLGGGDLMAYGVSKGALHCLTRKLGQVLAKDRIRVNWISVGWVLTEMEYEVQAQQGRDAKALDETRARLPMGQFNTVEDIAAGCVYLASDDGVRVSGTDLNVTAGMGIRL
jgi:NAD(P)-dependent dehydrogenase (short-subunit alcohol dehydrogenase family)